MPPRRRTILVTCVAVATTACASSGSQTTTGVAVSSAPQQITTAQGQNIRINTTATTVAVSEAVPIGADSAYNLLLKVYKDLAIPTTNLDSRQRLAGNFQFKIRRKLGGIALSKYLDCGNKDGVSNADEYDIALTIASAVGGASLSSSTISTSINGVATHPMFSTQTACATTGELEKRIAQAVNAKLAGK